MRKKLATGCNGRGMTKRKIGLLAIVATLLATTVSTNQTKAATETTLLGTGSSIELAVQESWPLEIENPKAGATYSYVSKNKKVATVNKKGIVKAVKKGTAKIVVTQTYKKKKTNVGAITFKVKQSCLYDTCKDNNKFEVAAQTGWITSKNSVTYNVNDFVQYKNAKATYKFYSSDSKKLKISTKGKITLAQGTGNVTVTIKETYKKKTRKVGSFKVNLKTPTIVQKTLSVYKTQRLYVADYLDYTEKYNAVCSDNSNLTESEVIEKANENKEFNEDGILRFDIGGSVLGKKSGTGYLYIAAYNYNTKKYDQYAGMITVKVKEENTATELSLKSYDPEDEGKTKYTAGCGEILEIPLYAKPYYYTGDIEVVSSDPSVVSFAAVKSTDFNQYDGQIAKLYLCAGQAGTATVTVKVNGAELSFPVEVKQNVYEISDYVKPTKYITIHNYLCEDINYLGYFGDELSSEDYKVESSNPDVATGKIGELNGTASELKIAPKAVGTTTITVYYKGQKLTSIDVEIVKKTYEED